MENQDQDVKKIKSEDGPLKFKLGDKFDFDKLIKDKGLKLAKPSEDKKQ